MERIQPDTLPTLVDLLLDAVFLVDTTGVIAYANAACEPIFGYTPAEMVGRHILDFVHPEDHERTRTEARRVLAGEERVGFENRYLRKDGSVAHIMWSARYAQQEGLRIGVARDITERKLAEERQAALLALSQAAHASLDLGQMFASFHAIFAPLLQCGAMAAVLEGGRKTVYSASAPGVPAKRLGRSGWFALPLSTPAANLGEMRLQFAPGTPIGAREKALLQFAASQAAAAIERQLLHDDLEYAARYDELTGLPNRRLFQDRLRLAFARSRRGQSGIALLFVDIDDFKHINDHHGHAVGDQLLKAVARRISACIREADTVARMGGDEFVALLENVRTPQDAQRVAEKIRKSVANGLDLGQQRLPAQASIGIAIYPEHGTDAEQLLRHADKAMYLDKAARKGARAG
ncbi:GGDEF domain-containing protein [Massilia sp. TS11]|uniref:GGDEF domain-containing protein n=1 Tax=Massilia sp. TS11 TaxID=2908003 RepID=UPI001EDA5F9C|nr:GGDEF domain-containing protein [Massilia sp. TS11]MCG2585819.1 diguanylate cyclase [Massilia sp. TS11]